MSTYWGYSCESHDPPLRSDHWLNHGEGALTALFHAVRAGTWPIDEYGDPDPLEVDGYPWHQPPRWLLEHPNCHVVLHNEYGESRETEGRMNHAPVPDAMLRALLIARGVSAERLDDVAGRLYGRIVPTDAEQILIDVDQAILASLDADIAALAGGGE